MKKVTSKIKKILNHSIRTNNKASIIISGGSSPINILHDLDNTDICWQKINVMLLDERLVDIKNKNSNESNLKENFFKNYSKSAKYQSIRSLKIDNKIDVAIMGFGIDGHFASIFPCHINDKKFIDVTKEPMILKTSQMGKPHVNRLTMNLSAFSRVENIFIVINSEQKLKVIKEAKKNIKLPIHYLLKLKNSNIHTVLDF